MPLMYPRCRGKSFFVNLSVWLVTVIVLIESYIR